jgi:hypothetical protein
LVFGKSQEAGKVGFGQEKLAMFADPFPDGRLLTRAVVFDPVDCKEEMQLCDVSLTGQISPFL